MIDHQGINRQEAGEASGDRTSNIFGDNEDGAGGYTFFISAEMRRRLQLIVAERVLAAVDDRTMIGVWIVGMAMRGYSECFCV